MTTFLNGHHDNTKSDICSSDAGAVWIKWGSNQLHLEALEKQQNATFPLLARTTKRYRKEELPCQTSKSAQKI